MGVGEVIEREEVIFVLHEKFHRLRIFRPKRLDKVFEGFERVFARDREVLFLSFYRNAMSVLFSLRTRSGLGIPSPEFRTIPNARQSMRLSMSSRTFYSRTHGIFDRNGRGAPSSKSSNQGQRASRPSTAGPTASGSCATLISRSASPALTTPRSAQLREKGR